MVPSFPSLFSNDETKARGSLKGLLDVKNAFADGKATGQHGILPVFWRPLEQALPLFPSLMYPGQCFNLPAFIIHVNDNPQPQDTANYI